MELHHKSFIVLGGASLRILYLLEFSEKPTDFEIFIVRISQISSILVGDCISSSSSFSTWLCKFRIKLENV
ncbi:unnamed protein product [Lactuca virosa]|uniref:Uncharacterized protein n=1 Tax=Lactuca virosa TaxID=75947 RepID=A0AAU9MB02_9ASTR|nr:unnamed protein product [Lactuca virosa]